MTLPKGERFIVDVLSNSDVHFGGDIEKIEKLSSCRYALVFSAAGEKTISISGLNRTVFASFYATESPAELIKARAEFILIIKFLKRTEIF